MLGRRALRGEFPGRCIRLFLCFPSLKGGIHLCGPRCQSRSTSIGGGFPRIELLQLNDPPTQGKEAPTANGTGFGGSGICTILRFQISMNDPPFMNIPYRRRNLRNNIPHLSRAQYILWPRIMISSLQKCVEILPAQFHIDRIHREYLVLERGDVILKPAVRADVDEVFVRF